MTACPGAEGTFTICSFWLVSALCEIGEIRSRAAAVREAALLRAARSACTARSSIPHTGRHLGNFPQAFTHLSLINAVMHLIHAERVTRRSWLPSRRVGGRRQGVDGGERPGSEPIAGPARLTRAARLRATPRTAARARRPPSRREQADGDLWVARRWMIRRDQHARE